MPPLPPLGSRHLFLSCTTTPLPIASSHMLPLGFGHHLLMLSPPFLLAACLPLLLLLYAPFSATWVHCLPPHYHKLLAFLLCPLMVLEAGRDSAPSRTVEEGKQLPKYPCNLFFFHTNHAHNSLK